MGKSAIWSLVPWFVIGFLVMATVRSAGLVPPVAIPVLAETSKALMIVSLAAFGLGVDVRAAARAGRALTGAVVVSVLILGGLSLVVIR